MGQTLTKQPYFVRATHRSEHPSPVAVVDPPEEADMPFAEGAGDTLDPDLRHRMISEAAYHLYAQRGYADGYELDDWLQAEAQVDHVAMRGDAAQGLVGGSDPVSSQI
jgi:Protein of unknown function (DUF2934)